MSLILDLFRTLSSMFIGSPPASSGRRRWPVDDDDDESSGGGGAVLSGATAVTVLCLLSLAGIVVSYLSSHFLGEPRTVRLWPLQYISDGGSANPGTYVYRLVNVPVYAMFALLWMAMGALRRKVRLVGSAGDGFGSGGEGSQQQRCRALALVLLWLASVTGVLAWLALMVGGVLMGPDIGKAFGGSVATLHIATSTGFFYVITLSNVLFLVASRLMPEPSPATRSLPFVCRAALLLASVVLLALDPSVAGLSAHGVAAPLEWAGAFAVIGYSLFYRFELADVRLAVLLASPDDDQQRFDAEEHLRLLNGH